MNWQIYPRLILGIFLSLVTIAQAENEKVQEDKPLPQAEAVHVPSSVADPKNYGHHAPYLLITCMDFRLRDEVEKFMELRVGKDTYDEFVIPGASLGVLNDKYPHWGKTFEDVLGLAIKLHGITNVIFLDHRACGAYKMLKGDHCCDEKDAETHVHSQQFDVVRKMMKEKYPNIKIETLIMGLDGQVETIKETPSKS